MEEISRLRSLFFCKGKKKKERKEKAQGSSRTNPTRRGGIPSWKVLMCRHWFYSGPCAGACPLHAAGYRGFCKAQAGWVAEKKRVGDAVTGCPGVFGREAAGRV